MTSSHGNSIGSLLQVAYAELSSISDTPRIDAELLLAHVLQVSRSSLYTWPEKEVEPSLVTRFFNLLKQRRAGHPVAYLIGRRAFWSEDFYVTPATLIPRPETEQLIEITEARFKTQLDFIVADLGTGSGIIALTLAGLHPTWGVLAVDYFQDALRVAYQNAKVMSCENVLFVQSDWCHALQTKCFDLIVSNPPYIDSTDPHLIKGDLRFEPKHALVSGEKGFAALKQIIHQATFCLKKNGWLFLEHGYQQGKQVRACMLQHRYSCIQTYLDLNQQERITIGSYQR